MSQIHPSAIVDPAAQIGSDCVVGPHCIVNAGAILGAGVVLAPNVIIDGIAEIGAGTKIGSFSVIAGPAQHLKSGEHEAGKVVIGANCTIREYVTINAGMLTDDRATRIGERCFIMTSAHVAHDCIVEDDVIITNQGTLAGHVHVGKGAILAGLCAVHQFTRIGNYAFIGGMSGVREDVIPYAMVNGTHARLEGLNLIGLKRRSVSREHIHQLRAAYKALFESGLGLTKARENYEPPVGNPLVDEVLEFLSTDTNRRFCLSVKS